MPPGKMEMLLRAAVLVSSLLHCSGESGVGTGPCPGRPLPCAGVSACAWQGWLCFGKRDMAKRPSLCAAGLALQVFQIQWPRSATVHEAMETLPTDTEDRGPTHVVIVISWNTKGLISACVSRKMQV